MELLPVVCLCLLTRCGITSADGNEPVVVPVEEDGHALLPCSLSTKENIEQGYFDWNKVAQNNEKQKEVFLYNKGRHSPSFGSQDDGFKGRVFHFPQELKHGNASIIIRNTKMADSGDYTCTFPESRQTCHIKLVVDRVLKDRTDESIPGAAPKPVIRTLDETENWRLLQCEVHGNPQPEVEWRDSAGKTLSAEEPQVTERDGRFYVTLNTTVNKTNHYRCVATQKTISHQIYTETFVRMNVETGNSSSGAHSSGSSTGLIVGIVVLALVFLVCAGTVAVLVCKGYLTPNCNKDSEKRKPLSDSVSQSEQLQPPQTSPVI